MKLHSIWALALAAAVSSCTMYDDLPLGTDRPGYTFNREVQDIKDVLASSEYGWTGVMIPGSYQYGGINFTFQFQKTDRVHVNSEDYIDGEETSYLLSHDGGTRLTFTGANRPIGRYAAPQRTLRNGLEGDSEYLIDSVSRDRSKVYLTGNYSKNKLVLSRLTEPAERYLRRIDLVRQALYGKAIEPTTIGGQNVEMAVFGLIRQLNVIVDGKGKKLPIYFTTEGVQVIDPEGTGGVEIRDEATGNISTDESQKIGAVGNTILTHLDVQRDGDGYKVVAPEGGALLAIQSPTYDLTKRSIHLWLTQGATDDDTYASASFYKFKTDADAAQASDWYNQSSDFMSDQIWLGKTDSGDPRFSVYSNAWGYLSYYMDFTAVYGQPDQFRVASFVQSAAEYRYFTNMINSLRDNIIKHSPYVVEGSRNTIRSAKDRTMWATMQ